MPIGRTMTETIALAQAAAAAAQPRAEQDSFRPGFHFHPPAQWMNDICGELYYRGYYHVFYQWNPFSDEVDWASVNSCWGHARSRDLLHWEHLPPAIAPSEEEGIYQCASGCACLNGDGQPMLFYGHTPLPVNGVRPPRQQWAALPLDDELRTWRSFPVGLAPGQSGIPEGISPVWTDMYVFQAGGRTFAIFKAAAGLVVEAQNTGLTRWQAVGQMAGVEGECPNFFALQGRWLLLRSTYPMSYLSGRFDPLQVAFSASGPAGMVDYAYGLVDEAVSLQKGPLPAVSGDAGRLDASRTYRDESGVLVCRTGAPPAHSTNRGFYATSAFEDASGRRLLLGWVGAFRAQGWNGCMSLPRLLSLDTEGRLLQTPLPELADLRCAHAGLAATSLVDQSMRLTDLSGSMLEVQVDFTIPAGEETALSPSRLIPSLELRLVDAASGEPGVVIHCDGRSLDANGTCLPCLLGAQPGHIRLHLFFDRSLLELFINDGYQVITRVAYPPSLNLQVELAARGQVRVNRVDVWKLAAAMEDRRV